MKEYSKLNHLEEGLEIVQATSIGPPVVKAVLTKETKQTAIGVVWNAIPGGGIKISKIQAGGLAATLAPDLAEGMKLLSINQVDFQRNPSHKAVGDLMRNLDGEITIVAAADKDTFFSTAVRKEETFADEEDDASTTLKDSYGIDFMSTNDHDIVIKSIHHYSPFANNKSGLGVGSTVLMINNKDCSNFTMTVDEANDILENAEVATIYFKNGTVLKPTAHAKTHKEPPHPRFAVTMNEAVGIIETAATDHPPPRGVKSGGVWGTANHLGGKTWCWSIVCCLICGLLPASIVCCFAFDKRRVYKVDNLLYNAAGEIVGDAWRTEFREGEPTETVDNDRMMMGLTIAAMTGIVGGFIVFSLQNS